MAFTFTTFTKTLILLVSVSVILLHTTTNAAKAPSTIQSRVYNFCKFTSHAMLCYQTILPEVEGHAKFNIHKALDAEIVALHKQVNVTITRINELLAMPGISGRMNNTLVTCLDQYDSLVDSMDKGTDNVANHDFVSARYAFGSVISFMSSCQLEFDFSDEPSPFEAESTTVQCLSGNILDILVAIQDRERRRHPAAAAPTVATPSSSSPDPCKGKIGPCT